MAMRPRASPRSTLPVARSSRVQRAVAHRRGPVGARGEDGDRAAAALERAAVAGGVDAERHAADDGDARRREPAAELVRRVLAVRGRLASADDRDRLVRRQLEQAVERPGVEQRARRVVQLAQPLGIGVVVDADRAAVEHARRVGARGRGRGGRGATSRSPSGTRVTTRSSSSGSASSARTGRSARSASSAMRGASASISRARVEALVAGAAHAAASSGSASL